MEHKHGFKLRIVTLFMVLVLLFSIPFSSASWTLEETRNYAYSGSSVIVELDPGVYEITLKGAKGHSPSKVNSRDRVGVGGAGGYIKINYTVESAMNVTLWVARQGLLGSGGWGRTSGASGPSANNPAGGGSTEIWTTSTTKFIAAADGGGAGGWYLYSSLFVRRIYGGGGGARGGSGGGASGSSFTYPGYTAGGSGSGGAGGSATNGGATNGGAGGQSAASGITVLSSSTGGSGTGGNGYITIKLIELPPVEEEVLNPLFFGGGI